MWLKWLPWKLIVRHFARSHGFLDPIAVLSYMRRFSQPSEVQEPIELLRAGVIMHARGLMNSRAIQHNLDWVWPYWVERQFNPADPAFIPRAFSLTHINLTHRNWTAVGLPDIDAYPIIDPAGAVMPLPDGWTLDGWIIADDGSRLIPSRETNVEQHYRFEGNLAVETRIQRDRLALTSHATMELSEEGVLCRLRLRGEVEGGGWLAVALRPCNPEGVAFIHKVRLNEDGGRTWMLDKDQRVLFHEKPERLAVSTYREGDVFQRLPAAGGTEATCDVGMITAAALYRLGEDPREVTVDIPLPDVKDPEPRVTPTDRWRTALEETCRLEVADGRVQFLYEAALRTLVLHTPGDAYPGPYTYRRFWFRDAAFILHALLHVNLFERAERVLDRFPERQNAFGFFHSQEGEWDSNGEALWILRLFGELSGRATKPAWLASVEPGARWILKKRLDKDAAPPYAGLLPAGFSAEHLGPNDYYYWDDFWGVEGLRAAAAMLDEAGRGQVAATFASEADEFLELIQRSLAQAEARLGRPAMPAAPERRLDAGAIGSIVGGYPLRLFSPRDERMLDTVAWLKENCTHGRGFFQDMIHSGINAYLTLHMAQVLLRAGDPYALEMIEEVAQLASPTGQWPEAIHPRTGGGCMGDGQHVWAAAEWIMALRNAFVYEERAERKLVLGAAFNPAWAKPGQPARFGPTPTPWGPISITISRSDMDSAKMVVEWTGDWRAEAPAIDVRLPGMPVASAPSGAARLEVEPSADPA